MGYCGIKSVRAWSWKHLIPRVKLVELYLYIIAPMIFIREIQYIFLEVGTDSYGKRGWGPVRSVNKRETVHFIFRCTMFQIVFFAIWLLPFFLMFFTVDTNLLLTKLMNLKNTTLLIALNLLTRGGRCIQMHFFFLYYVKWTLHWFVSGGSCRSEYWVTLCINFYDKLFW